MPQSNDHDRNSDGCTLQLLTPPGRSAVATIGVTGDQALETLLPSFRRANGRSLDSLPLHAITFGTWSGEPREVGQQGEGVVVARTRPNRVEIHCHGGTVAAKRILDDLALRGCRLVQQLGETTEPKSDHPTIEKEARFALAHSLTERTAMILLDQLNGALKATCQTIIHSLDGGDTDQATSFLQELLATYRLGRHLTQPWQVALAGPANVGKSSLINTLVGYQRAIVFNQPGTTRDVVTAITAIDGWPVELADTAGLRETSSGVEVDGMQRARDRFRKADVAVLVLDARSAAHGQAPAEEHPLQQLRSDAVCVFNKFDLIAEPEEMASRNDRAVFTSATTAFGIDELLRAIHSAIMANRNITSPLIANAVLFTERQRRLVEAGLLSLEANDPKQALACLQKI